MKINLFKIFVDIGGKRYHSIYYFKKIPHFHTTRGLGVKQRCKIGQKPTEPFSKQVLITPKRRPHFTVVRL